MNTVRVNLSEGRWFRGTPISATAYYTTVVVTDPGTVGETLGRAVICSKERIQYDDAPLTEWVSFHVVLPVGEMATMHAALQSQGFVETDRCEYSRGHDAALVTYGPCEAPRV